MATKRKGEEGTEGGEGGNARRSTRIAGRSSTTASPAASPVTSPRGKKVAVAVPRESPAAKEANGAAPKPTLGTDPSFFVKYAVVDIPGKGKGVVAMETVAPGQLVWAPRQVVIHDEPSFRAKVASLPKDEAKFFLNHVYSYQGKMFEILGDGQLWK